MCGRNTTGGFTIIDDNTIPDLSHHSYLLALSSTPPSNTHVILVPRYIWSISHPKKNFEQETQTTIASFPSTASLGRTRHNTTTTPFS